MPRRSRSVVALVALVALIAFGAGVAVTTSGGRDGRELAAAPGPVAVAAAPATTAPTTSTTAPAPPNGERVDPIGSRVDVFAAPDAPAPAQTLSNPTWERVPLVLHAIGRQGDWLHVRVNTRPNGSTGWVRAADVRTTPLTTRVVVDRAAHLLRVYDGHTVVLEEPVAVGTGRTPTPTGSFYIDAVVENPGGIWGAYQLSVAGFSEVHTRFLGGIGQIAIHGTNRPALIGGDVSNGCIRMRNDSITRLAAVAPLGTAVEIV